MGADHDRCGPRCHEGLSPVWEILAAALFVLLCVGTSAGIALVWGLGFDRFSAAVAGRLPRRTSARRERRVGAFERWLLRADTDDMILPRQVLPAAPILDPTERCPSCEYTGAHEVRGRQWQHRCWECGYVWPDPPRWEYPADRHLGVGVAGLSAGTLVAGEVPDGVGVAGDETDPEHGVVPPQHGGDDQERPDAGHDGVEAAPPFDRYGCLG